jgi:hypothetical protein
MIGRLAALQQALEKPPSIVIASRRRRPFDAARGVAQGRLRRSRATAALLALDCFVARDDDRGDRSIDS